MQFPNTANRVVLGGSSREETYSSVAKESGKAHHSLQRVETLKELLDVARFIKRHGMYSLPSPAYLHVIGFSGSVRTRLDPLSEANSFESG